ncbi:MAG TPA: D-aminoacylase [Nitriliruptorales bacterium]
MVAFDVVLRGGRILDGTGGPAQTADVGITGGRIDSIGDLSAASAEHDLDVSDRYVCPGFIDVHAHTDLAALLGDEHLDVKTAGIRQGVTTEVCGNCGASPFPTRDVGRDPYFGLYPKDVQSQFVTTADYRATMDQIPLVANLAPLLGHGALRAAVVGYDDRPATDDELREMRRIVAQAMEEGAFGLSSGLIYAPAVYAPTQELIALATEAGRYGRPYTTHMRDEADHVLDAIDEALRIGREAGTGVQISHHKVAGERNWGRSQQTLQAITEARAGGTDVTIDVYPYTAGSTILRMLLPPWALDGGHDRTAQLLGDDGARHRIARAYERGIDGWQNLVEMSGWDGIVLCGDDELAGHSIAQVAHTTGRQPVDVAMDVVLEDPGRMIIIHMMEADEVNTIGGVEFAMVGSDGIPAPGRQHPRLAGTFARVLGRARGDETHLADVVRRSTSLAAQRFHLGDRGRVTEGFLADLVVFDGASVADRATYEQPLLAPTGIDHVLVAGRFAVRDGALTDVRAGAVLEPS